MPSILNTRVGALPGITSLLQNVEKELWWGHKNLQRFRGYVLDGAALDIGNTSNTTRLRPGLLMGMVTATKKLKQWDPDAVDGTEYCIGAMFYDQTTQHLGNDLDRQAVLFVGGNFKESTVLVPGSTSYGLAGNNSEFLIRSQLSARFQFDDITTAKYAGAGMGGWSTIRKATGDLTVTEPMNGTLFSTFGAVATVDFTLPATPQPGLRYGFYAGAAYDMLVVGATNVIVNGDNNASSITIAGGQEGGFVEILGQDTSKWLAFVNVEGTATAAFS